MSQDNPIESPADPADLLSDAQARYLQERLASEQNLPLGIAAGAVATLLGAGAWAATTMVTEYQIGFMAIGIGLLVGFAVRVAGKGVTSPFGVVGALFSLLGCLAGNLLAVTAMAAQAEDIPISIVLPQLTPVIALELMAAWFSPVDLLFYGIAIYYGFKLSFRQIKPAELNSMLEGREPG